MPKPAIRCKLCDMIGPAADAHVIPKAFYKVSRGSADYLDVISSVPGVRRVRSRIGFYDQNLLCQSCEARFMGYDTYGVKVLLQSKREPFMGGDIAGIRAEIVQGVDRQRFNGFLVFLLWRVLASALPAYQTVTHPELEEGLRQLLLAGSAGTTARVQVLVTTLCHSLLVPEELNLVLNGTTYVNNYLGVRTANIGLGKLLLIVNLDPVSFPQPFGNLAFPGCMGLVGNLLITGSAEFSNQHLQIVAEVVRRQAAGEAAQNRVRDEGGV